MIEESGNMWSIFKETNFFIFTGNSYLKTNGALVMGRGLALEVRTRIPGIDLKLGKLIHEHIDPDTKKYGFLTNHILEAKKMIGIFQVKTHYQFDASLDLIKYSAEMLLAFALLLPDKRFDMNFPGIGYGRLKRQDVLKVIKPILPDNIRVWSFKE